MNRALACTTLLTILLLFQTVTSNAQSKWQPFGGLHLAMNADGYYTGLGYSAGATHSFKKNLQLSIAPEMQFFTKKRTQTISSTSYTKSKFVSYSLRLNLNYFTGHKKTSGFFIGGGLGFLYASDKEVTYVNDINSNTNTGANNELTYSRPMITLNFGYSLPFKGYRKLQFIVSMIGPYHEGDYYSSYTEIISVLTAGVRLIL